MKNSASNPSIMQALHAHAQQLLPTITQALAVLQYTEIVHQRLAQTNTAHIEKSQHTQSPPIKRTGYQGLTRASHAQFGRVMIKWQLETHDSQYSSDLAHEIHAIKSLNHLSPTQHHSAAIVPLIVAEHHLDIQLLGQMQQLTAMVMCYYPNGSLAPQIHGQKHGSLTAEQKHHLIKQSAQLIAKLHHAGWLHNDIKPSNILLDGSSTEKAHISNKMPNLLMTDFALAEYIDSPSRLNNAGTPAYLAPERWQGQGATIQSDIYAFGIMMVEIVTGARPFQINKQSREPMTAWAMQHCQQPIPRLPSQNSHYRDSHCQTSHYQTSHYQNMVDKALAKRVENRYQSMEAILESLEKCPLHQK